MKMVPKQSLEDGIEVSRWRESGQGISGAEAHVRWLLGKLPGLVSQPREGLARDEAGQAGRV